MWLEDVAFNYGTTSPTSRRHGHSIESGPVLPTLQLHTLSQFRFFHLDANSLETREKQFFSSSDSEDDEDSRKKFKIKIKPLVSDSARCVPPSMDELKASVGGLALSPSLVRTADVDSRPGTDLVH